MEQTARCVHAGAGHAAAVAGRTPLIVACKCSACGAAGGRPRVGRCARPAHRIDRSCPCVQRAGSRLRSRAAMRPPPPAAAQESPVRVASKHRRKLVAGQGQRLKTSCMLQYTTSRPGGDSKLHSCFLRFSDARTVMERISGDGARHS